MSLYYYDCPPCCQCGCPSGEQCAAHCPDNINADVQFPGACGNGESLSGNVPLVRNGCTWSGQAVFQYGEFPEFTTCVVTVTLECIDGHWVVTVTVT